MECTTAHAHRNKGIINAKQREMRRMNELNITHKAKPKQHRHGKRIMVYCELQLTG